MLRGGKRPGAGAPRGNLNAVKSGRYSRRLRAIARGLGSIPEVRDFLLDFQRRQRREERRAARIARRALLDFISSAPAENNPIVAYLRHSLTNEGINNIPFQTINSKGAQSKQPT